MGTPITNNWAAAKEPSTLTATITAKGQITIPSDKKRNALKLDKGDPIVLEENCAGLLCVQASPKSTGHCSLKGLFGKPKVV
jgi:bifunctional DNA-binding transcriptional regulator/antitoxin component of YhaV-PrlF toxin-antitoxin module